MCQGLCLPILHDLFASLAICRIKGHVGTEAATHVGLEVLGEFQSVLGLHWDVQACLICTCLSLIIVHAHTPRILDATSPACQTTLRAAPLPLHAAEEQADRFVQNPARCRVCKPWAS